MRIVNVILECDWPGCDITGPEGGEEVREKELAVDRKKTKVFLICIKHREALDDVLLPLLRRAITVDTNNGAVTSRTKGVRLVCQICGETPKGRPGFGIHVSKAHGMDGINAYIAQYGEPELAP